MIACAARLAGAILLEGSGQFLLVGNTKEPCNWSGAGFSQPPELPIGRTPVLDLNPVGEVHLEPPCLTFEWDGATAESLAQVLASRLLIQRNGSVSERLWRLVMGESEEIPAPAPDKIDATWLVRMPEPIWNVVRNNVLKCS